MCPWQSWFDASFNSHTPQNSFNIISYSLKRDCGNSQLTPQIYSGFSPKQVNLRLKQHPRYLHKPCHSFQGGISYTFSISRCINTGACGFGSNHYHRITSKSSLSSGESCVLLNHSLISMEDLNPSRLANSSETLSIPQGFVNVSTHFSTLSK